MATVKTYQARALQTEVAVARQMGVTPGLADKTTRVLVKSLLIIICVLVKLLVDKGVLTDADLDAAFSAAEGDSYADEPVNPNA